MIVFHAQDLWKHFGALMATAGVSLELNQGEVLAVIGPNGAGKTTLFNLITGVFAPDKGRIFFRDREVTSLKPHELCRLGLARSFQITNIFQGLTVFENIRLACQGRVHRLGLLARVTAWRSVWEEAEAVLRQMHLWDFREELAGNLSHGDQRFLEIGLALATRPTLLLLDEPTAGMTPTETRATINLLQRLRTEVNIILIEHDLEVVFSVADRIMVLHQGQVLTQGAPDQVRANALVQAAYFGEEA